MSRCAQTINIYGHRLKRTTHNPYTTNDGLDCGELEIIRELHQGCGRNEELRKVCTGHAYLEEDPFLVFVKETLNGQAV